MLTNSNFTNFQHLFEQKLSEMLSPDELGAFILVLANSMQNEYLRSALKQPLDSVFTQLKERSASGELQAAPDDMAVFSALQENGIDGYSAWQKRDLGVWRCAYNPLRTLRPARASSESFQGLQQPFDEQRFHFDKAFLRPEVLGEDVFENQPLRVLYHKFPFIAYHLLILPDAAKHQPQFLNEQTHRLSWKLAEDTASNIAGFGLAFNSLGAGASVNHLHLHGYIEPEKFSVEQPVWTHNGGDRIYPVSAGRFESLRESWEAVEVLHSQNQPYNLLYRPGLCYVVPRAPQGERNLPAWMHTAVWHEISGAFNLSDSQDFEFLTAEDVELGLKCLRT